MKQAYTIGIITLIGLFGCKSSLYKYNEFSKRVTGKWQYDGVCLCNESFAKSNDTIQSKPNLGLIVSDDKWATTSNLDSFPKYWSWYEVRRPKSPDHQVQILIDDDIHDEFGSPPDTLRVLRSGKNTMVLQEIHNDTCYQYSLSKARD